WHPDRPGAIPRTRGVRAVRLRPGRGHPQAARSWRPRHRAAQAAAVHAAADQPHGSLAVRRQQGPPGRRRPEKGARVRAWPARVPARPARSLAGQDGERQGAGQGCGSAIGRRHRRVQEDLCLKEPLVAVGKEIRGKIKSVENTKKITKAMEMVAASKMRKAQERMRQARPYSDKVRNIAANLGKANPEYTHPFMKVNDAKAVGFIVVSTDKGLCGGMNTNVL